MINRKALSYWYVRNSSIVSYDLIDEDERTLALGVLCARSICLSLRHQQQRQTAASRASSNTQQHRSTGM